MVGYIDLKFIVISFVRYGHLSISNLSSLKEFIGYMKSYSFYEKYTSSHPNLEDPADVYMKRLDRVEIARN